MSGFVLDASVTLCWCFQDQSIPYTETLLERLGRGEEAIVPFVWPIEVANVLVSAERRRLLKTAQSDGFLEQLTALPIRVDSGGAQRAFTQILAAARRHKLSAYDAAYLELAIREGLPVATMDSALRAAAKAAGVRLVSRGTES